MMETDKVIARAEHTEALQLLRHYSYLRFVSLPIYLTFNGALLHYVIPLIQENKPQDTWVVIAVAILGIVLATCFGSFEYLIDEYINQFGKRAIELEERLGFSLWSLRPKSGKVITKFNMYILFLGGPIGWLSLCCWHMIH